MAIPTALMRGHTHAGEGSLYCQQAFGCPSGMPTRRERTLSKINLSERRCEHAMRREGTLGSAKAQIRGHRSIAVGTPRGRPTECSEVAAAFEHWGERVEGPSTATWATCAAANSAPSRPLKRCIDVLCQFLSGGQGARARSDAWVLDSVFFVTASTVVG